MDTSDKKGVLRKAILSGSGTLDNNLALNGGDKSSVDYTTSNESRETFSVSRPLESHSLGLSITKQPTPYRLEGLEKRCANTFLYPSDKYLNNKPIDPDGDPDERYIDGKYLDMGIIYKEASRLGKKIVLVSAGLGVGKSYGSKKLMAEQFNDKGVAANHRIGLSQQQCKTFDAVNYKWVKVDIGGESVYRLVTTLHSLRSVLNIKRTAPAFDNGLFVLDESESCANEFLTSTIKNEALVIDALNQAVNKAKFTLCLDAHMSQTTLDMLNAAGFNDDDVMLVIAGRPELEGYTVNLYRDEQDYKGSRIGKAAFINQILDDLSKGLKVIVTSLSAAFLDELNREAEKRGITSKIKITSQSAQAERDSLTADTYQLFELTMLSPSMSTGISFDGGEGYRHADRCYVYAANNQGTGNYTDALQAMMRERKVKDKTIRVMYSEPAVPLSTRQKVEQDNKNKLHAALQYLTEKGLLEDFSNSRPNQDKVGNFLMNIELREAMNKQAFDTLFIEECMYKGANVIESPLSELASGDVTSESLKEELAKELEREVEGIANALKVTEDMELPDDDSDDVRHAVDRRFIENEAVIDFDDLPHDDKLSWVTDILPKIGGDLLYKIRDFERALAPIDKLNEIVKIALVGEKDSLGNIKFAAKTNTGKVFMLDKAHLTRLALKDAGVTQDENGSLVLDAAPLHKEKLDKKKSGLSKALSSKGTREKATRCGWLSEGFDFKSNPSEAVIQVMKSANIPLRKVRGKDIWTVNTEELSRSIDMLNRRKTAGVNDVQSWLDRVNEWRQDEEKRKALQNERDFRTRVVTTGSYNELIEQALSNAGNSHLLNDALHYFEPFKSRWGSGSTPLSLVDNRVRAWLRKMTE